MDFSEFTKQIQNMLTDEEGHYEVSVQTVTKNNGIVYTGLSFREIPSGAAPVVYLEPFFERYNNGTSMENITEEIKKIVSEHRLDFDAASINDFDNVRNKIVYVLINKIKNADFLKSVPNIDFVGDMVVIFKYELCDGDLAGNATITVTNALQEMWALPQKY